MNVTTPIRHDPEKRSYEQWWAAETRRRAIRLRRLVQLPPDQKIEVEAADFWACHDNCQYWIEQYGWMINPKAPEEELREVPVVLFDRQVEFLNMLLGSIHGQSPRGIDESYPVVANKGRELGISWICILVCYWLWRFYKLTSSKLLSRKESLVDDGTVDSLFGKLRYTHSRQPQHLRERNVGDTFLKWRNPRLQTEIIGEATNPGAGRGGRKTIVLFDEFAHVQPKVASAAYKSCQSVSKAIWMPSTPNGSANRFAQLIRELPEECVCELDWTVNPYRAAMEDPDWKKVMLLTMSESDFAQEYECSLTATTGGTVWSCTKDAVSYSESDPEWERRRENRHKWWHVGGWDFGSGPSSTVCLFAVIERNERGDGVPTIWLDDELLWRRVDAQTIAEDSHSKMRNYSRTHYQHWGDPAGVQKDAEQMSWEMRLSAYGLRIQCLPGYFNTTEGLDWSRRMVQWFLDSGKLRIHERCRATWEAVEEWRWDIPEGIPMEFYSKENIQPRKDDRSHPANALQYLVGAVAFYFHRQMVDVKRVTKALRRIPAVGPGNLAKMLGRMGGPW